MKVIILLENVTELSFLIWSASSFHFHKLWSNRKYSDKHVANSILKNTDFQFGIFQINKNS